MIKLGLGARLQDVGFFAEASTRMLQVVATAEVLIALLVILPSLLRVLPWLSTAAAAALGGIAALGTAGAIAGGSGIVSVNLSLAALAAIVACGRLAVRIAPFEDDTARGNPVRMRHVPSHP